MDLARFAMKGILDKTALDPSLIDYINFGTVIQGVGLCCVSVAIYLFDVLFDICCCRSPPSSLYLLAGQVCFVNIFLYIYNDCN